VGPLRAPLPPPGLRQLVGPTDDADFDNPSGSPVFEDLGPLDYSTVVDFGCGCGRVARQLLLQRPPPDHYVGIDVNMDHIRWCREELTPLNQDFRFEHLDVTNVFNPGPGKPDVAPFPVESGWGSLVVGISILTHIPEAQLLFYLKEIRRVLNDRGRAILTLFLFDRAAIPWLPSFLHSLYIAADNPTACVFYDWDWLLAQLTATSLIVETANVPNVVGGQTSILVRPAGFDDRHDDSVAVRQLVTLTAPSRSGGDRGAGPLPGLDEANNDPGELAIARAARSTPGGPSGPSPARRVFGVVGIRTGDEATLPMQEAAIRDYCQRRHWELSSLEDSSRIDGTTVTSWAIGMATDQGADTIVTVYSPLLAGAEHPIEVAETHGLGFVAVSEHLDTTTEHGRSRAMQLIREAPPGGPAPVCDLPIPPPELRHRVSGSTDASGFDEAAHFHLERLDGVLRSVIGCSIDRFADVLDFGCGCGRLLRRLRQRCPGTHLVGADIDGEAIEWIGAHLSAIDVVRVNPLPPIVEFDGSAFDLIIGFSVFTHLNESYQNAWLAELYRLLRPGGIGLLTVHGELAWQIHSAGAMLGDPALEVLEREFRDQGFAHWTTDGWESHFQDFYHTTFHSEQYVRSHWSPWFDVLAVVPGDVWTEQDVVVVRSPT
jgi:SAM-dependent methyltransferase